MFSKFTKIALLGLVLIPTQLAFASTNIVASGADTMAGNSTILQARGLNSGDLVNFVVEKPDGIKVTLPVNSDVNGVAKVELYDYHTYKAGLYKVSAYLSGSNNWAGSITSVFRIYPASVDPAKSTVNVNKMLLRADGKDSSIVSAVLMDRFGNPIVGRALKIISSNSTDVFTPSAKISDSLGRAQFSVSSLNEGVSYLTVLDTTESIPLTQRVQLSFSNSATLMADAGGGLIKTAYAADVGPLSGFDLADFPVSISPNENITFKVKATDATAQVVQDYTGTIRFSAEGDNSSGVTLPANYKFLAEDLGQHQFNLGLSFTQAGTYKIVVNDLADKFKKGEKTVIVGSGSASTPAATGAEKIILTTPAAGSYSQAQQTISGKSKASANIKIYDNKQEIGATVSSAAGKFSFQTTALKDSKHSIYVVASDAISLEVSGNSDPVDITIDTTPPKVDDLQLDPTTGIKGGSVINVKVFSEAKLSQAALIFNSDIIPLNASIDDPSAYIGSIQAPAAAGAYGLNVLVSDTLQNEKTYENVATVNVDPAGGKIDNTLTPVTAPVTTLPVTTPTTTTTPATSTSTTATSAPSAVSGVISYGSDKRVTLVWDAAKSDTLVKKYKIYYGEDVKSLAQSLVTKDASTTWYVPSLENGKEYFFAVTAIDDAGTESANRSEIVSGIPFMLEIKNALSEAPTKSIAQTDLKPAAYDGPFPPKHTGSGPELLWLFVPSLGLAGFLKRKR